MQLSITSHKYFTIMKTMRLCNKTKMPLKTVFEKTEAEEIHSKTLDSNYEEETKKPQIQEI